MSRSVPLQADCRRSVRSGHRKLPPSSCSRWRRAGATWRSRGEEFITSNELPVLLEMAKRAGTHILPIILKSCGFTSHQSLSVFQAVNDPHRPVLTLSVHEQELTRQCSATSVIVSTGCLAEGARIARFHGCGSASRSRWRPAGSASASAAAIRASRRTSWRRAALGSGRPGMSVVGWR
jgi:hypothetical protein